MAPMQMQSRPYVHRLAPKNIMVDDLPILKRNGGGIFDGPKTPKGERDGKHDNRGSGSDDDDDSFHSPPTPLISTTTRWLTQPPSTVVVMQTSMVGIHHAHYFIYIYLYFYHIIQVYVHYVVLHIYIIIHISNDFDTLDNYECSSHQHYRRVWAKKGSMAISTTTVSMSSTPSALSDSEPSSSGLSQNYHGNSHNNNDHDSGINPITEKVLISAGSIGLFSRNFSMAQADLVAGIFVIIAAIIYLVIRMKKLNRLAKGDFSKNDRAWYGRRRSRGGSNRPPSYSSDRMSPDGYPDEKFGEREIGGYYAPESKRPFSRTGTAPIQVRTDIQRQPSSSRSNYSAQAMSNSPIVGPSPTAALQNHAEFYYTQAGTLRSQQSGQSSNAYDPTQMEVNRVSYLSSISSGFGDQLIMPEGGPLPEIPVSRFSWTTASQTQHNRDTIYTTTSEETAPRFRTVNSWVAQQTGRVERKQLTDQEIPIMPEIPASYNIPEVPAPLFSAERHQRNPSENPAFKHHPGDQVELQTGSRVPSAILDRKIGI
ncbi:hypothetical protein CJF30_00005997 [Rutstroemia sp. NJR-2017a BBW]|nr:hypothetical protein CJF30_00005997 [Rutstroemia sp. NJR-2017a BBW]